MKNRKNKMNSFLEDLLKMPYFRNYAATSGNIHNVSKHEDAIEDVLLKNGFRFKGAGASVLKKTYIGKSKDAAQIRDIYLSGEVENCGLVDGEYILQPCGTHNSPDFLVRCKNNVFGVEAKSCSGLKPMYNGGFPKSNYIYAFCSERMNQTVVYMGSSVNGGDKVKESTKQMWEEIKQVVEKYNHILGPLMPTGLRFYVRNMWTHAGKKDITSYFNEPRRTKWLQEVKDFINE